jgi:hypothetical protein
MRDSIEVVRDRDNRRKVMQQARRRAARQSRRPKPASTYAAVLMPEGVDKLEVGR